MRVSYCLMFCGAIFRLSAQNTPLTLQYSGGMLGYYAVPKIQDTSLTSCVDADQPKQVQEYLKAAPGGLLVNTGDLFAPYIWSRQMYYPGGPAYPGGPVRPAGYYPKELYQFGPNSPTWILMPPKSMPSSQKIGADNVACFLRLAHFQAVVPGKHDFYFGPENLRKLASLLAEPPNGAFAPVQMLAANLFIASTPAKSTPSGEGAKDNRFTTALNGITIPIPDVVHPAARVFHLAGPVDEHTPVFERAGLYADSDHLNPESDAALLTLTIADGARNLVLPTPDLRSHIGMALRVCARVRPPAGPAPKSREPGWLCSAAFTPFHPLLQYSPGGSGPRPGDWATYQNGTEKIAVVGVVDPNLLEHVGLLNYSWLNDNPNLDTQVKVSDPLQALSQIMEACNEDLACHGSKFVVLAEMAPQTARVLAAHLQNRGVLAVITRADEDLATPSGVNASDFVVPPVLTPKPAYHSDRLLVDALDTAPQKTTISPQAGGRIQVETQQASAGYPVHVEAGDADHKTAAGTLKDHKPSLAQALADAFGKRGRTDVRKLWEYAALESMMAYCRSDIAMLQHRDVFAHPDTVSFRPTDIPLQLRIDQALWKGDIAVCAPVTGATIKAMLKDSDNFDRLDASDLAISEERNRGLARLGLSKGDDAYVVNGAPLDDKKLYSVAMTDYLASGDTGYPELRVPAVPPVKRIRDYHGLIEIGVLLCHAMQDQGCRGPLPPEEYFDRTSLTAYNKQHSSPGLTELWQDYLKSNFLPSGKRPQGVEDRPQNQPRTILYLDKADYGLAYNTHTGSEKFVSTTFNGIPIAQVTAKEQRTQTIDWSIRLTRSLRRFDVYAASDASYAQTRTRNLQATEDTRAGEPFLLNQTRNQLNGEVGLTHRLLPFSYRSGAGLKFFVAARVETQLVDPQAQFALGSSGFETGIFAQPRNYYVSSRSGLRWDGKKSWIEAGFGFGPKLNALTGYTFTGIGKTSACSILDTSSCTADLKAFGATVSASPSPQDLISRIRLDFATGNRFQYGFFSTSKIALPIGLLRAPAGLGLTVENQTQLFFRRPNEDTSVDTRYFSDFTIALSVPVVGNLSLAPKLDLFFFRNKTLCPPHPAACANNPEGAALTGQQTSVTLKYSFDWHNGLPWRKALRYPNPSSLK